MFLIRPLLNIHAVVPILLRSKNLTTNKIYRRGLIIIRNIHLNNIDRITMTRNLAATKKQQNHTGHSNNIVKCWKWNVNEILNGKENAKYAILILNCKITQKKNFIKHCWNTASLRITVDGGTTHWDRFLNNFSEEEKKSMKNPDLVTGDFDSILEEVLHKYEEKHCKVKSLSSLLHPLPANIGPVKIGSAISEISQNKQRIINTPDQDYTDFTKAVIELNNYCEEKKVQMDYALVIAQTSGRLDQILGNIQTLHLIKEKHLLPDQTKVYIISDSFLTWLLYPGDHVIDIPIDSRQSKDVWCSLIPVGEPCESVTTSGLKWNLDNQQLKFGGLVSTSNTFDGSEQVMVRCSHTLLWSMKVPSLTL